MRRSPFCSKFSVRSGGLLGGYPTFLYPIWPWYGCLNGVSFRNGSWWKQRRMGPKVKQITLWTQSSKWKLVWSSKTSSKKRGYHKSQFDPCVIYRNDSVILTCVNNFVIDSNKQETITSLIESLKNAPENYVLADEGDISNYLGFNIKKNLDRWCILRFVPPFFKPYDLYFCWYRRKTPMSTKLRNTEEQLISMVLSSFLPSWVLIWIPSVTKPLWEGRARQYFEVPWYHN